eukprot:COSAG06_NODE_33684_length_485_cov_26.598446_2_plen_77_part_01
MSLMICYAPHDHSLTHSACVLPRVTRSLTHLSLCAASHSSSSSCHVAVQPVPFEMWAEKVLGEGVRSYGGPWLTSAS